MNFGKNVVEKGKKNLVERVKNMTNLRSPDNKKIGSSFRSKTKKSIIVRMNMEDYTHVNDTFLILIKILDYIFIMNI